MRRRSTEAIQCAADHTRLEATLHPEVSYVFVGMPAVQGRREVVADWRRLFATLSTLVSVQRRVREARLSLSNISSASPASACPGGLTANAVAVLTLEDDRIRSWSDGSGMPDLSPERRALGVRLRSDLW